MGINTGFNNKLNEWGTLVDNLTPHLADLPHLTADHDSLSALVTQTRTLQAQQDLHLAALRVGISQRGQLAEQARKLRNRLVAGLQSAFDHESDKLREFGIKPRVSKGTLRLTDLEKAQNAVARAVARAAELAAAKPPASNPVPPPAATE